jgi:hypothetical protein
MEQRDYLMRQIEQLGQVLARMLARLLNMKQVSPAGLSIDEIRRIYGDELDLTLDLVLQTPKEELIGLLASRIKFIDHHLERMAEILAETADLLESSGETGHARDLRKKSILILEHLQATTGAYSMERAMKISRLRYRSEDM